MNKPRRHPTHRHGLLVTEDQLRLAELMARELRLENSGIEFDFQHDESWLRVTHKFLVPAGEVGTCNMQELHLILFCRGEVRAWPAGVVKS